MFSFKRDKNNKNNQTEDKHRCNVLNKNVYEYISKRNSASQFVSQSVSHSVNGWNDK